MISLSVSVLGGLACLKLGARFGFVDMPDGIKTHTGAAVPLGGLAILFGVAAGTTMAGALDPFLAGSALLLVALGLIDDRHPLDPRLRLLVEAIAATGFAAGIAGPVGFKVGVAVAVVVMVNAINLIDGLDLLAGLTTATALGAMAVLAVLRGLEPIVAIAGISALVGFLILNKPPARLFLGDNGAYLCGLLVVASAVEASTPGAPLGLAAALSMASVPLFDLGATILRRIRGGSQLFTGDRKHTYDLAAARLGSVTATAGLFTLGQAAVAVTVIAVDRIGGPGPAFFAGAVILALAVLVAAQMIESGNPPYAE